MARYEDEFATRFTAEGQGDVTGAMRGIAGASGGVAGRVQGMINTLGQFAPQIQAAGDRMWDFSKANINAYMSAQKIDQTMESMFKRRGMDAEIEKARKFATEMQATVGVNDEVTKSSMSMMASYGMGFDQMKDIFPYLAAQADVFAAKGLTVESVADQVGRAFGSGNYSALRRSGITMDEETVAILKRAAAMRASGDATQIEAGRQLAFNALLATMNKYTPIVGDRMKTLAGQQERFNALVEDAQEVMGEGVAGAHKSAMQFMAPLLNNLTQTNPELLKTIGYLAYFGGGTIKAGGWIGNFVRDMMQYKATLNLAKNAKDALKASTVADTIAEEKKAGVAVKEAAAIGNVGKAAEKNVGILGKLSNTMTGGLGFGGLMTANAGAALGGGLGVGAAATSIVSVAAAAMIGWMIGKAVGDWLEGKTGYQTKGGEALANNMYGTRESDKWAGTAATKDEIELARARARGEKGVKPMKSGQQLQNDYLWKGGNASVPQVPKDRRTKTTPSGDLRVTIPGDQVATAQATRDHAKLR